MPAKSKKQQQFFGVVRSMQKGDIPKKGEAGKVAGDMKKKSVKDFAKTKHKGLPTKVKKENVMNVKKWIQQEIRTALKEIDGGAPLVAPDGTIQGGPTKKKKGLGGTSPLGEADVFDAPAGDDASSGTEEPTANMAVKKFDLLLKDKAAWTKVAELVPDISDVKQAEFVVYLLTNLGVTDTAKKKLKLKL